ncbi:hypothetical protein K431DRAFT_117301 [Polychaeton citri CBS 116435]|uniref:Uncharacterized protein n=1 Tax=Polychaeton citri CBS 116435 TaxID=1314669 RepID=A0A9P4UTR9_9PEZI|nr:hypothetical protein K431DRAFT_117301 [Polychaeton citri CBS 116435]
MAYTTSSSTIGVMCVWPPCLSTQNNVFLASRSPSTISHHCRVLHATNRCFCHYCILKKATATTGESAAAHHRDIEAISCNICTSKRLVSLPDFNPSSRETVIHGEISLPPRDHCRLAPHRRYRGLRDPRVLQRLHSPGPRSLGVCVLPTAW